MEKGVLETNEIEADGVVLAEEGGFWVLRGKR